MKSSGQLSIFFLLLFSLKTVAQEIIVIDFVSKSPIEGAAVYNFSKKKALLTNEKGKADLSLFLDYETLNVQFYGYETFSFVINKLAIKDGFTIKLNPKKQTLDEVILSIGRTSAKRKQIAEKVQIINANKIKFRRPSSGADLVGLVPGVRIQKSQGGGGSPVIRGFEANRLLVVVDGVRMNNAIYRSGHLQNTMTINPNNIERVEVIFGSSSVGYGSDALGGVIQYFTKSPLINSEQKISTNFSTDFSSANNAFLNFISTEVSFKKWASLTSLSHSKYGDIRMGKNRTHGFENWGFTPYYSSNSRTKYSPKPLANENNLIQKNTGYDQFDLFQKFLIKLDGQNQFILNFQYSNSSDISRYDKLVEETDGSLRFSEWYYGPQKRFFVSPQLKFFPGKKFLNSGRITLAYQNIEESRVNRYFGSLTRNNQKEKVTVWSFNLDFKFEYKKKHSFSYGFESTYNDVLSFAFSQDLIIKNNKISGYSPSLPIPTRYPSQGSSYASFAGFFNWIWDINEKVSLNAGVRLTKTNLRARWKEYYNINALLSKVNLDAAALTETIALTYRPNLKTQLNFIFSNGFRNPNIDDVGKIRESKGNLIVPNPNLFPEYAYNSEVGITRYLEKSKNYFSLRGFTTLISRHIGRDNYIIFADTSTKDLNTIIYKGEELTTLANNNLGNRNLYGASVDGYFSFTQSLSVKGNLSYIRADNNKQYSPLPSISPIYGSLVLNYQKDNWLTSLRFEFSGKKNPMNYSKGGEDGLEETPLISENPELYNGTPAWNDISLLSQCKLKKNINLNLGIDNILDLHYRTFASGISAPGRNLKLGINFSF